MKVGTDGVILGAWTDLSHVSRALDVGTGTGLLALMIAQRKTLISVDAIEIDRNSAQQAKENTRESRFKERIRVICTSLQAFQEDKKKYDLVICNPPFFSDSFKPSDHRRNMARHDVTLPVTALIDGAVKLLQPDGRLSIIVPLEKAPVFMEQSLKKNLYLKRELKVRASPDKTPHRTCMEFSFLKIPLSSGELIIELEGRHNYSKEYRELTEAFYL